MADLGSVGQSGLAAQNGTITLAIPAALNITSNPVTGTPRPINNSGFCVFGIAAAQNIATNPITGIPRPLYNASFCLFDVVAGKSVVNYPIGGSRNQEAWGNVFAYDRKTIRGFTKDQSNNVVSRTVIAVDQVTQKVIDYTTSDPGTGAFTLRNPYANKTTVLMLALTGDARNSVTLSDLLPI